MIVRIGNCDVVAGVRKVVEQMLHVSHSSSGRQALDNVMGSLSNDLPTVPTAIRPGAECPCRLAKSIRCYLFGSSEGRGQVASVRAAPIGIIVGLTGSLPCAILMECSPIGGVAN